MIGHEAVEQQIGIAECALCDKLLSRDRSDGTIGKYWRPCCHGDSHMPNRARNGVRSGWQANMFAIDPAASSIPSCLVIHHLNTL